MASRLDLLIELLHAPGEIALATRSLELPEHPFASIVNFATDAGHRPLLLLSRLAEHTRNLLADPRASLSLARSLGDGEIARISLIGELRPVDAEALLVARYLRLHPEAERFLGFGDFSFFGFTTKRIRIVGGFAQAGWLDPERLRTAPQLTLAEEAALLEEHASCMPAGTALLAIDAYGADCRVDGRRRRLPFPAGPVGAGAAGATLRRTLAGLSA